VLERLSAEQEKKFREFNSEVLGKAAPVPEERQELVMRTHLEGHYGADAIFNRLYDTGVFWAGMRKMCDAVVAKCPECIRYNVTRRSFDFQRSIHANRPWEHIAIDLLTFDTTSPRGFNYVLVMVCVYSRFHILAPLVDKSAAAVAARLWETICLMGAPKIMQSDNGTEFVNRVVRELTRVGGVDHRLVAPYNPRANGAAESGVKLTKSALVKMCGGNVQDFDLFLPGVQRAINARRSARTGAQPHFLMFGRHLELLGSEQDAKDRDDLTVRRAVIGTSEGDGDNCVAYLGHLRGREAAGN
jgi:transposase InsO family protein